MGLIIVLAWYVANQSTLASDVGVPEFVYNLPNYPDWMGELPAELHNIPLHALAIPGSHDTTAAYFDPKVTEGPDCTGKSKAACNMFSEARKIIHNWAVTQSLNYTQQLEVGVRYFDLRLEQLSTNKSEVALNHGLMFSHSVQVMASAVNLFLEQHPTEIVLLDLSHLSTLNNKQHIQVVDLLMKTFGSKLCPYMDIESITLNILWKNKLQVIAIYEKYKAIFRNLLFWPPVKLKSPWANKQNCSALLEYLEGDYNDRRKPKSSTRNKFYVTQGQLTANAELIINSVGSTLREETADKCNTRFVNWLSTKKAGNHGINIVILDFVEMSGFIPTLMELNSNLAKSLQNT